MVNIICAFQKLDGLGLANNDWGSSIDQHLGYSYFCFENFQMKHIGMHPSNR